MLFLEDLRINKSKVFIFGISSEYGNYLINLFVENEIEVCLWDKNISLIIDNKDKEEFKNKYITFLNPKDANLNNFEYIIINDHIEQNSEYYSLFKDELKSKICSDFDIIQKIYPEIKFNTILGNSGQNVVKSILKYVSNENRLNLNDEISVNFPFIMSFEKLTYTKNIKFSTIIIYEYDENYFVNKENLELFNKIILNNEEIKLVLNVDDFDLKELYESLQDNKDFLGKVLPISISKILNDGVSYVNGTIYDYYHSNSNYDVLENENIDNDFTRLCILLSYVFYDNNDNVSLENKNIVECFSTYSGEKNFFEHVKNIENVCVVNNTFADSDYLLQLPYKTYKNIYTVLFVNGIGFDKKFFESKSKIVFYVDKQKLLDDTYENVFFDEKDVFDKIYSLCVLEKKEDKVTILLTTSCINKNSSLFNNEINNIKNVIEEIKN